MNKLLKTVSGDRYILLARLSALVWLVIGLVTTILDIKFAWITPTMFFILGFASLMDAICNELYRIILLLEKRAG